MVLVKQYIVEDMSEVELRTKNDIGEDAIILKTEEITTGGFLGLFKKKKVKVLATSKQEIANVGDNSFEIQLEGGSLTKEERREVQMIVKETIEQFKQKSKTTEELLEQVNKVMKKDTQNVVEEQPRVEKPKEEVKEQVEEPVNNVVSEKIPEVELSPNVEIDISNISTIEDSEENNVSTETVETTEEIVETVQSHNGMHPELERIISHLESQELSDNIIEKIVNKTNEVIKNTNATSKEVQQLVRENLSKILDKHITADYPINDKTKVVYFFGPTGVGKTTTIAKLSADFTLTEKRKVGLITSDTYRIGAAEQLKTYANILNVPLEIVYSEEEMKEAFSKLSDCDLILVDTAGRNYLNDEYLEDLNKYISPNASTEKYLVLSMTSKQKDMQKIIENFKSMNLNKVIFTKVDETTTYGPMVNTVDNHNLQFSFVTTGQNVPDDIHVVTNEFLSNLILGGKLHV